MAFNKFENNSNNFWVFLTSTCPIEETDLRTYKSKFLMFTLNSRFFATENSNELLSEVSIVITYVSSF